MHVTLCFFLNIPITFGILIETQFIVLMRKERKDVAIFDQFSELKLTDVYNRS